MVNRQPGNLPPLFIKLQKVQSLFFCLSQTNKLIETRRRVCYAAVEVVVGAAREAGEEMFQETMDIVENVCHKGSGASTNKKSSYGCWEIRNQPTILFSDDHIHLLGSRAEHRNTNFRNYNAR